MLDLVEEEAVVQLLLEVMVLVVQVVLEVLVQLHQ